MRICERKNSDTKVSEKGGGGDAPGVGVEILLQPVVTGSPWKSVVEQPLEDPRSEQGDAHRKL